RVGVRGSLRMDERDWGIPIEPKSNSKVTSLPLRNADTPIRRRGGLGYHAKQNTRVYPGVAKPWAETRKPLRGTKRPSPLSRSSSADGGIFDFFCFGLAPFSTHIRQGKSRKEGVSELGNALGPYYEYRTCVRN